MKEKTIETSPLNEDKYIELAPFESFKQGYLELLNSPYDLWYLYLVKIIGYSGYSISAVVFSLYLTEILDYSDTSYAWIALGYGSIEIIYAALLGGIIDRFGVRVSFMISSGSGLLSYILLIFIEDRYFRALVWCFGLSITWSLNSPTGNLAVKKYTSGIARNAGISIFYVVYFTSLGIAGLLCGIVFSIGRDDDEGTYLVLFIIAAGLLGVAFVLSYFLREIDYELRGTEELKLKPEGTYWEALIMTCSYKAYWRVIIVALLVFIASWVISHLTFTLPLYMDREIESNSKYGYIVAFSNFLTILFCPLLGLLAYYYKIYTLLIIGGIILGLSPLILLFGANYTNVLIFVTIVSIGESLMYPRLVDFTLDSAIKGREGAFFIVSNIPSTLGFTFAGFSSGLLLDEYCPEDGERNCSSMWVIISIISLGGVLLLILFKKWLENPVIESNPYISWSNEDNKDN